MARGQDWRKTLEAKFLLARLMALSPERKNQIEDLKEEARTVGEQQDKGKVDVFSKRTCCWNRKRSFRWVWRQRMCSIVLLWWKHYSETHGTPSGSVKICGKSVWRRNVTLAVETQHVLHQDRTNNDTKWQLKCWRLDVSAKWCILGNLRRKSLKTLRNGQNELWASPDMFVNTIASVQQELVIYLNEITEDMPPGGGSQIIEQVGEGMVVQKIVVPYSLGKMVPQVVQWSVVRSQQWQKFKTLWKCLKSCRQWVYSNVCDKLCRDRGHMSLVW